MKQENDLTGTPHVYLSKYSDTQYRIDVAIKLEGGQSFEIEENQGRVAEKDADYYLLNISGSSGTEPTETSLLTASLENIVQNSEKIAVVAYYSNAPAGEKKAKKKVKVLYADADEGGSGG